MQPLWPCNPSIPGAFIFLSCWKMKNTRFLIQYQLSFLYQILVSSQPLIHIILVDQVYIFQDIILFKLTNFQQIEVKKRPF